MHATCSRVTGNLRAQPEFVGFRCSDLAHLIDGIPTTEVLSDETLIVVDKFYYLGDVLSSGRGCTRAIYNKRIVGWGKFRKLLLIFTLSNFTLLVSANVQCLCAT